MKYYTGIGSRETPAPILALMAKLAQHHAANGYILRSGGADGADAAFEYGCAPEAAEIYLPWKGFNGCEGIDTTRLPNYAQARKIAELAHPNWEACSEGTRKLHTRNVYQVLGTDLQTPSRYVLCWAYPHPYLEGEVQGGTGQAVRIANTYGIPVFNLYIPEHRELAEGLLTRRSAAT